MDLHIEQEQLSTFISVGVVLFIVVYLILRVRGNIKKTGSAIVWLTKINDYWIPALVTGLALALQKLIVELPLTLEGISSINALLFRILVLSWAFPIARTLMDIYVFFGGKVYTMEKATKDFKEGTTAIQRLWLRLGTLLFLTYLLAH